MREAVEILLGAALMILAVTYPFIGVLRGRRADKSFFLCWWLLIFSFGAFSLFAPMVIFTFDKEAGHMAFDVVPDTPIIVVMTVFGWFYAGISILFALLIRSIVRYFVPEAQPTGVA